MDTSTASSKIYIEQGVDHIVYGVGILDCDHYSQVVEFSSLSKARLYRDSFCDGKTRQIWEKTVTIEVIE